MLFALGLAGRGYFKGDAFVAGSVVAVALLVAVFTFFPGRPDPDLGGCRTATARFRWRRSRARLFTEKIWGLGCIAGNTRCGVAWNTLTARVPVRGRLHGARPRVRADRHAHRRFAHKKLLRILSVLPIITPPFVIGLGLILLFGRSGLVNQLLEYAVRLAARALDLRPAGRAGRAGVRVHADRLPRADRRRRRRVAQHGGSGADAARRPLARVRRHLAAADAARPRQRVPHQLHRIDRRLRQSDPARRQFRRAVDRDLLLGGRRAARPGSRRHARHPAARASRSARSSLQRGVLGRKVYTSLAGKGDAGLPTQLPDGVRRLCYGVALPWAALTVVIYAMALVGGFVETWGRDYTLTLRALHEGVRRSSGPATASCGRAPRGTRSGRRSSSPRSPRRSPPRSASCPPTCSRGRSSPGRPRSSSARCCRSRFPAP